MAPPVSCIVDFGITGKHIPGAAGACCSATQPPHKCYAEGNGMCPGAGSTTKCQNPSDPGAWSCEWATTELVWAEQRRYAIKSTFRQPALPSNLAIEWDGEGESETS